MRSKVIDKRIKVGFIVQMPEIWDKEAPVFEKMINDDRFSPKLIVVPSYDFAKSRIGEYGDELAYFQNKYDNELIIKAFDEKWVDIESLQFDYVFFQRCYEHYLPEQYRTNVVANYAKTCYIPYCYHSLIDPDAYYMSSFFANLHLFFTCSRNQFERVQKIKQNGVLYDGYPVLDLKYEETGETDKTTILWTPRWTNDPSFGGTTFIDYLYKIPALARELPAIRFIVRPHPMAFQNAIKEGLLSEQEIDRYKEELDNTGVVLDKNTFIEDTFKETDILITDFSSSLVAYYLTGKPIIYCTNTDLAFVDQYQEIVDCSYKTNSWIEVKSCLADLLKGIDPLKETRERLSTIFASQHKDSASSILNSIEADARKNWLSKLFDKLQRLL